MCAVGVKNIEKKENRNKLGSDSVYKYSFLRENYLIWKINVNLQKQTTTKIQ